MLKRGRYRHYKAQDYEVIGVAKHEETHEDMVVYKTLYENEVSDLWVRPLDVFTEEVEIDGKTVPRFQYIDE